MPLCVRSSTSQEQRRRDKPLLLHCSSGYLFGRACFLSQKITWRQMSPSYTVTSRKRSAPRLLAARLCYDLLWMKKRRCFPNDEKYLITQKFFAGNIIDFVIAQAINLALALKYFDCQARRFQRLV